MRTFPARLMLASTVTLLAATLALATPASATNGQPGKELPYQGVMAGSVSVNFAPYFPFVRDTFGGRCSVPSDWVSSWTATGEATHLGLFSGGGSTCARVDFATGVVAFGDGVGTLTAANGDTLNATLAGYGSILDGTETEEWTLVGGTGRFAGATGQARSTGRVDVTTTPYTFASTFEGWIAYDASQAS